VSNYIMTCHSSTMKLGLASPPCVNTAPTYREPFRSRFTFDEPDTNRSKFLNMFKVLLSLRNFAVVILLQTNLTDLLISRTTLDGKLEFISVLLNTADLTSSVHT
jgi:hypothetical protein